VLPQACSPAGLSLVPAASSRSPWSGRRRAAGAGARPSGSWHSPGLPGPALSRTYRSWSPLQHPRGACCVVRGHSVPRGEAGWTQAPQQEPVAGSQGVATTPRDAGLLPAWLTHPQAPVGQSSAFPGRVGPSPIPLPGCLLPHTQGISH